MEKGLNPRWQTQRVFDSFCKIYFQNQTALAEIKSNWTIVYPQINMTFEVDFALRNAPKAFYIDSRARLPNVHYQIKRKIASGNFNLSIVKSSN